MRHDVHVAVLGGTGFYDLPELCDVTTHEVTTPFGAPSSPVRTGRLGAVHVAFLPRHGLHHTVLPHEINARANIYALKSLGVRRIVAVSAVGSLRQAIEPGHMVLPTQVIDRTHGRPSTFFGNGVVAHVSLADPICPRVHGALVAVSGETTMHPAGTYICIEGPQFSSRAESHLWRSWGADVVGMTCLPEARLAREAEICYGVLALPTDYDAWRADQAPVNAAEVAAAQKKHVATARQWVAAALGGLELDTVCACERSLENALMTPLQHIDASSRRRLQAILGRSFN